jgi:hypothetical protein
MNAEMPPIEDTCRMCPLPYLRAEHVGLQLGPDLGLADLLDHAEVAVPSVVHDDVEPPEEIMSLLHRGEVRVAVGDVKSDGQQRVTVLGRQIIEAGDVPGGRRDLIAAIQGRDRPLAAEAARGTGNEPGLHSHQVCPSSCRRAWY